jgi:hypothetical protein
LTFRIRLFMLAGVIVLVALIAVSAPDVHSQDETSTPGPPTSFPTVASGATLAAVPFGDTFDETENQWQASGNWSFDPEGGYDGGGWVLDGTQGSTVSILEYKPYIDLHGALGAQIMFRQRGSLPLSDLVAVEISLDGGATWFIVDAQIGVQPPIEQDSTPRPPTIEPAADEAVNDWILREVSLKAYRNQVIRLRFRVQTGIRPPDLDLSEAVYQIDNLSIQYVEEYAFASLFSGPHTLLGLHLIMGARSGPVLDFVNRLRNAGWPLGTIKGTTGTEAILAAVAKESPETIIVYRSLETPRGMVDCPNSFADPVAEANDWMAGLWPEWANVPADYFEIMNECLPPLNWLVPFTIEAMRLATERGYCLLVFSFAGASPEPYQYRDLQPVYEYALKNPCQPGRRHGIALHAYGVYPGSLVSESGIWLGFRYRLYYDQILPDLPDATLLPVFLTEVGPGDGRMPFKCETITRDMIQYTQQVEKDPYIQGFHLWNLGAPTFEWIDVTDCLPMLGDALINYYAGR